MSRAAIVLVALALAGCGADGAPIKPTSPQLFNDKAREAEAAEEAEIGPEQTGATQAVPEA